MISDLKRTAKILKGAPPLLIVCKYPQTEDNNHNFARGSPTKIFLNLVYLVKLVSVPLTERKSWNFTRGYPTELFFLFFWFSLVKVVLVSLTERNNRNFARVSPTELFFCFFRQHAQVVTRKSGVWIDFHFSDFYFFC